MSVVELVVQLTDGKHFRPEESVKMVQGRSTVVYRLLVDILIVFYERVKILFLFEVKMWIEYYRHYGISVGIHASCHKHRDAFHHTYACAAYAKNENFLHATLKFKNPVCVCRKPVAPYNRSDEIQY